MSCVWSVARACAPRPTAPWCLAHGVCKGSIRMTANGVQSQGNELRKLAEELYETQGHLDPAVVGYSPYGLHLKETEQCAISVVKRPPGPAFCLTTRPSIGSSLCQPSRSAVWLSPCGAQSEVLISVQGKRRERRWAASQREPSPTTARRARRESRLRFFGDSAWHDL